MSSQSKAVAVSTKTTKAKSKSNSKPKKVDPYENEIKLINFDEAKHTNVSITGYKMVDKNYCGKKGIKYEVGNTYVHTGDVIVCSSGFHFCLNALDCYGKDMGVSKLNENKTGRILRVTHIPTDNCQTPSVSGKKLATAMLRINAEVTGVELESLITGYVESDPSENEDEIEDEMDIRYYTRGINHRPFANDEDSMEINPSTIFANGSQEWRDDEGNLVREREVIDGSDNGVRCDLVSWTNEFDNLDRQRGCPAQIKIYENGKVIKKWYQNGFLERKSGGPVITIREGDGDADVTELWRWCEKDDSLKCFTVSKGKKSDELNIDFRDQEGAPLTSKKRKILFEKEEYELCVSFKKCKK